jgi:hypothetical protein
MACHCAKPHLAWHHAASTILTSHSCLWIKTVKGASFMNVFLIYLDSWTESVLCLKVEQEYHVQSILHAIHQDSCRDIITCCVLLPVFQFGTCHTDIHCCVEPKRETFAHSCFVGPVHHMLFLAQPCCLFLRCLLLLGPTCIRKQSTG